MQIFTRCQGDRYVVNRGEGLTAVDFGEGDAATTGAIGRSEGTLGKENRATEVAGGMVPGAGIEAIVYCRWGREGVAACWS
ncbi:hypothetical protein BHE74_00021131 [Ensete ventricosum]|nr:hypothetical protein BHE74_00021131 [Ensete ventricosum]RZR98389.1 hypothetical protein BHM03_00027732 [Ensete ventricosum]